MSALRNQLLPLAYLEVIKEVLLKEYPELARQSNTGPLLLRLHNALQVCYGTLKPYKLQNNPQLLFKALRAVDIAHQVLRKRWEDRNTRRTIMEYLAIGLCLADRTHFELRTNRKTKFTTKTEAWAELMLVLDALYACWDPSMSRTDIMADAGETFQLIDTALISHYGV